MGSLTSRPKVPAQPQVVYVPQPTQPTPAAQTADPTPVTAAPESAETEEEVAARVRTENLLQRNRGRFGTVNTSLRGLLSLNQQNAERKTLLGE